MSAELNVATKAPLFNDIKKQGVSKQKGLFFGHYWTVSTIRSHTHFTEFGHLSRGGTWYEIANERNRGVPSYDFQAEIVPIGGPHVLKEYQTLYNPYWFIIDYFEGESLIPEHIFNYLDKNHSDFTAMYKRTLKTFKPLTIEGSYSIKEMTIARWLRKHGYDGVLIYYKARMLRPSTNTERYYNYGRQLFVPRTQLEFMLLYNDPTTFQEQKPVVSHIMISQEQQKKQRAAKYHKFTKRYHWDEEE